MSTPFIGNVKIWAGNFAPLGYAFCNGQLLSIAQNNALFALIGTTYGGDGQSTFALPDMRSRLAVGQGQGSGLSPYVLGQQAGVENVTLTSAQMPGHTHALQASTATATTDSPSNNVLAAPAPGGGTVPYGFYFTGAAPPTRPLAATAVGQAGGNQPHSNIMPVLALSYIIALEGIFPARN